MVVCPLTEDAEMETFSLDPCVKEKFHLTLAQHIRMTLGESNVLESILMNCKELERRTSGFSGCDSYLPKNTFLKRKYSSALYPSFFDDVAGLRRASEHLLCLKDCPMQCNSGSLDRF